VSIHLAEKARNHFKTSFTAEAQSEGQGKKRK
jgi:hypothetical protein